MAITRSISTGDNMTIIMTDTLLSRNVVISNNPKAKEILKKYFKHAIPDDIEVISREEANQRYSKEYGEYQLEIEEDKRTILLSYKFLV